MARFKNRENQFSIGGKVLAANMYQWSQSVSEESEQIDYYDGESVDDVTKKTITNSFQCHNDSADEAIALVRGLRDKVGDDLKQTFEYTDANGTKHTYTDAYVKNIVSMGGDANGRDGLSFDVVYTVSGSGDES